MSRVVIVRDIFKPHQREFIQAQVGDHLSALVPPDLPKDQLQVIHNGKSLKEKGIIDAFVFSSNNEEIYLRVVPGFGIELIATLLFAVVSVGLQVAAALLAPKPRAPNVKSYDNTENSPTYSWDGVQNTTRNGTPIALVYGKHKVAGQVLSCFTTHRKAVIMGGLGNPIVTWEVDDEPRLYMLLGLCAGPIGGINDTTMNADYHEDTSTPSDMLKIDNNPGGSFSNVAVSYRMGTWTQAIVAGFDENIVQYVIGGAAGDLTYQSAYVYTTDGDVECVELLIAFPAGLYRYNDQNAFMQYEVDIRIRYRINGEASWTTYDTVTFSNRTRTEYKKFVRIDGLPLAQYQFELYRETADDGTYTTSTSELRAVNEITFDDVAHKGVACTGIRAVASEQLSGQIPHVTQIVYGKECVVYQPGDDFSEATEQDFWEVPEGGTWITKMFWGWNLKYGYGNPNTVEYAKSNLTLPNALVARHSIETGSMNGGMTDVFWYKEIYSDAFDVRVRGEFVGTPNNGDGVALCVTSSDSNTESFHIGLYKTGGLIKWRFVDNSGSDDDSGSATTSDNYYRFVASGSFGTLSAYTSSNGTSWTLRATTDWIGMGNDAWNRVGLTFYSETSTSGDLEVNFTGFEFADTTAYAVQTTNNPAWVVYDLLVDADWGIGNYIDSSQVDLDTFINFAAYCDELVSDGRGGYHHRHSFDGVLDSPRSAWEQIIRILEMYRATILKQGDKIRVAWQREQDPVQVFADTNIKRGSFVATYKTPEVDANYWEMQFLNKENDWEQDFTAFVDPDIAATEPYRRKTVPLYGVTRIAEAQRAALFRAKLNRNVTQSIAFECGIDAIACEPYDVISVSHSLPAWGENGRVASATSSSVTLEKPVTIELGNTYQVKIRHNADDSIETRTVSNAASTTKTLTVSETWDTTPSADDVWVFGQTDILTKQFIVTNIERTSDLECRIEAAEHNDAVYDDTGISNIPRIVYSALLDPRSFPGDVSNLVLTERAQLMRDGTIRTVIDVTFSTGSDATRYDIFYREEGISSWIYAGSTVGLHYELLLPLRESETGDPAIYEVAVLSVNASGRRKSPYSLRIPKATIQVYGHETQPDAPTNLAVALMGEVLLIKWDPVAGSYVRGYELRKSDAETSWDTAQVVVTDYTGSQYQFTEFVADAAYYFMVKTISRSGIYSASAASVSYTVPERPNQNILVERDERTSSWNGTKVNMTVDTPGYLVLDSGQTTGSYTTPELDAGSVVMATVKCEVFSQRISPGLTWDDIAAWTWDSANAANTTWSYDPQGGDISVAIKGRRGDSSPLGGAFTTWIDGIYTNRYYEFKVEVVVNSPDYSVKLKDMFSEIDTGYT